MASKNIQFNAIIADELAKRVKQEAIEHDVTLGEFSTQAFQRFLALTVAQRRIYLGDKKQRKILGRKIAA